MYQFLSFNLHTERLSFGEIRKRERGLDEFGVKRKDIKKFYDGVLFGMGGMLFGGC